MNVLTGEEKQQGRHDSSLQREKEVTQNKVREIKVTLWVRTWFLFSEKRRMLEGYKQVHDKVWHVN
jgi:hypothetical protein